MGFGDSHIETYCIGDTMLPVTPHPAFDAGRPCRTSDDTDASKQACVASDSSCRNRHHGALRGRGTLADGGAGGLRETEAPPARRSVKTPFWSKGNLLTSLGWNRTRFFVQSASALQPSDRQGGQSASRLCHSLRKADQPRLLERRVHPRGPVRVSRNR